MTKKQVSKGSNIHTASQKMPGHQVFKGPRKLMDSKSLDQNFIAVWGQKEKAVARENDSFGEL